MRRRGRKSSQCRARKKTRRCRAVSSIRRSRQPLGQSHVHAHEEEEEADIPGDDDDDDDARHPETVAGHLNDRCLPSRHTRTSGVLFRPPDPRFASPSRAITAIGSANCRRISPRGSPSSLASSLIYDPHPRNKRSRISGFR